MASLNRLLTEDEAAPLCGTLPKTLANWRSLGIGPKFIKSGRLVRYDPDDIQEWKSANRYSSTSQAA